MIIRTIPERISESTVDIVRLQELCRNSTAGDIENLIELYNMDTSFLPRTELCFLNNYVLAGKYAGLLKKHYRLYFKELGYRKVQKKIIADEELQEEYIDRFPDVSDSKPIGSRR